MIQWDMTLHPCFALALTHNPKSSLTSAILVKRPDHSPFLYHHFLRLLKERLDLARHPTFLAYILVYQDFLGLNPQFDYVTDEMLRLESLIGQTDSFEGAELETPQDLDLPSITQSLNLLASTIARSNRSISTNLRLIEQIQAFERKVEFESSQSKALKWGRQIAEMKHFTDWMAEVLKTYLFRLEQNTKDVQIQLAIVRYESPST